MITFIAGMFTGFFVYLICCALPMPKKEIPPKPRRRKSRADWWKNGDECPY